MALNVTAVEPSASGFLTVWPTGAARPNASNLNFTPGETIPNMVIARVGTNGLVSIFNFQGSTHVVVDVLGWFPTGTGYTSLVPTRLLDTRPGSSTGDGLFAGVGAVGPGQTLNLTVGGRGGVPASGAGAVALNVTAVAPSASGFLTVWPAGSSRPNASNLNFTPGQVIPNMVIAQVGANGVVSIYNSQGFTDVVVDVLGWFPTDAGYTSLVPGRLLDTRAGAATVDGLFAGVGKVGPGQTLNLTVTGRGGVPASGVGTVALNVTVTNPSAPSFLTVWPTGAARPNASNLNFTPGETIPNMVIVQVGTNGLVSIYNHAGATDVIVDVLGWFPD